MMDGPTRIFRTQQTPVLRGFIDFPPTRFRFCFSSSLALSLHVLRSRELFLSFILFLSRSDSFEMEKRGSTISLTQLPPRSILFSFMTKAVFPLVAYLHIESQPVVVVCNRNRISSSLMVGVVKRSALPF